MKIKLALTAAVIAALAGSTVTADAKSKRHHGQSTTGSSSMTKGANTGAGMTTGAGRGAANPSSEGNVGPGTINNMGKQPGGR
jgi:hypothetical protein